MKRENIDMQRAVLLNIDAPHHTRLRKIISRGFTPRAVGRLRDELDRRAHHIVKSAAAQGSGDFVEQVSCELPLQAIAGLLGVGGDVLSVGQFRRRRFRPSGHLRHLARSQPARRIRRHRRALVRRGQPGPDDDQRDFQRDRRPYARLEPDFSARATAIRMVERHQALAGRLRRPRARLPRRSLTVSRPIT